ncbi:MAG: NAD(P)H-dependent oxidoreductase [Pyrinomonadaceae bacterium]
MESSYLFILGSARPNGNTELLARLAARSLLKGAEQKWLNLLQDPLPVFEDIRHHETRKYAVANDTEQRYLDATLVATDIVIASPVYWYSLSASSKLYLDHWSAWMRLPNIDFRRRMAGKTLWGITVLSDEQLLGVHPLIETLRLSADYLDMQFGGVLLGYGNRPGDILSDAPSLDRAEKFLIRSAGEVGLAHE